MRAQPIDGDHGESKEDPLSQLRNLRHVCEVRHTFTLLQLRLCPQPFVLWGRGPQFCPARKILPVQLDDYFFASLSMVLSSTNSWLISPSFSLEPPPSLSLPFWPAL